MNIFCGYLPSPFTPNLSLVHYSERFKSVFLQQIQHPTASLIAKVATAQVLKLCFHHNLIIQYLKQTVSLLFAITKNVFCALLTAHTQVFCYFCETCQ